MALEFGRIQGLLFSGFMTRQRAAAYLFFTFGDAHQARTWIAQSLPAVTVGEGYEAERRESLQIAFTHQGLAAAGLSKTALESFSRPFIEGMSEESRSRSLGDDSGRWRWGKPDHRIHVLLILFAHDAAALAAAVARERARALAAGFAESLAIESQSLPGGTEHFGFADGIANPAIDGDREKRLRGEHPDNVIKAGEFILGYDNEYGLRTFSPTAPDPKGILAKDNGRPDLGRNGSYLVVRQMRQDVAGFWNALHRACSGGEEGLGAKIVGRWQNGTPLTLFPQQPGPASEKTDAFGYSSGDGTGLHCPIGAHIRRANPRDAFLPDPAASVRVVKRHRLLRRGRPYGPPIADRYADDAAERGLVFVALNANIERQFEFVQHAWISSPSFANHYDEADPLLGGRARKAGKFSVPDRPIRRQYELGMERFVEVVGGAYFFLPGIKALEYLSSL